QGESSVEVPSFLVDVGALRPLLAEQTAPAPDVRASLSRSGGQITLDVENRSAGPLADVAVIVGDSVQKLEDFGPGERRSVQLDQNAFFGEIPFRTGGVINRSAAVNALRNRFFVVVPAPGPQADMPPPPAVSDEVRPLLLPTPTPFMGGPLDPLMPPVQPVTLLAWSTGPHVELALDDRPLEVQGDTLYMWTVGEAR
ncbi:MAG: hypothetical protein M3380_06380, partial [Chloroflexota bacterium]|nr:hypothetical protein [Chloroflexota bacterium]